MLDGRRKMTDAQRAEALERFHAGEAATDICKDYGVNPQTIYRINQAEIEKTHVLRYGKKSWSRQKKKPVEEAPIVIETMAVPQPAQAPSFYNPSRSEIARLKAKGLGNTQIAALLRLPYKVIEGVRPSEYA